MMGLFMLVKELFTSVVSALFSYWVAVSAQPTEQIHSAKFSSIIQQQPNTGSHRSQQAVRQLN